jgi:alkylation response protein AidB-like acyl-CoA dehydrogenase
VSDFAWSADQVEFQTSVRRFFAAHAGEEALRRVSATADGHDPELWSMMASDLGLHGLAIAEEYGGAGFTLAETAIVHGEAGRVLLCSPFLASISLTAPALQHLGGEGARQHLPGLASGAVIGTLAVTESSGSWDASTIRTTAHRREGERHVLSGSKVFVPYGEVADLLVVAADSPAGLGLFAVSGDAEGLTRTGQSTLDPTRRWARVDLDETPGTLLGTHGEADAALAHAVTTASIALAAEQVGGAQRALELTVDYVKMREQFGRPIGTFQAIRHRLADLHLEVEAAASVATHAALVGARGGDVSGLAALARSASTRAYRQASEAMIQMHGATGFTWEHISHLYYKRARSDGMLLGGVEESQHALATAAGLPD